MKLPYWTKWTYWTGKWYAHPMSSGNELLSVNEVAEVLGISPSGVYQLLRRGRLRKVRQHAKGTRVSRRDLDAYVSWLNEPAPARTSRLEQKRSPHEVIGLFVQETGLTPAQYVSAWQRDEIDDDDRGMELLMVAEDLMSWLEDEATEMQGSRADQSAMALAASRIESSI